MTYFFFIIMYYYYKIYLTIFWSFSIATRGITKFVKTVKTETKYNFTMNSTIQNKNVIKYEKFSVNP